MKHPKTTISGILMILVGLGSAALALLQGHPIDATTVLGSITGGIGLITAADAKPTS